MTGSEREVPSRGSPVSWDATAYDTRHAYVARYGADLVDTLAPLWRERVLDLGCGTGHLSARIAARGAEVIGIDSSPEMIERARSNYPGLDFRLADATDFQLDEPVDAVFSNAVLHWVTVSAQDSVAACVRRTLRPGGRFVAELGGKGNVGTIIAALRSALETIGGHAMSPDLDPWYFPTIGEYASVLERQGLAVVHAELFDRLTTLENGDDGMRDWIEMFAADWLALVPRGRRRALISAAERGMRDALYHDGHWTADYRRLRIMALRES